MKRITLRLDESLLDEALCLSGVRSKSAVVHRALADFVRRLRVRSIHQLAGSGLWDGDLASMRGDDRGCDLRS
jgi:Arc/MetJ family transcription regulator